MNRRDFLFHSGGGLGGIALAALLGADRVLASAPAKRADGGLHHRPKAKRVVQLFMAGGASHVDLFDFKPELVKQHGKEANFGAHGGCKQNEFWGHLNYVDHTTGYHVDSVEITGYLSPFPGSTVRDVCGIATTNAAEAITPVYFRIRLVDNGEPGVADLFGIRLSNGYSVTPRLLGRGMKGGGNVQLHDPNPSTAFTGTPPDELTMCHGVEAP